MKNDFIVSPMNYIGNKRKLLPQILALLPNNVDTFVDLFAGGCTVGVNACCNKVVFNDSLTPLVDLYKELISKDLEDVLSHIDGRVNEFSLSKTNKEGYLKLRELYNTDRQPLDLFVLMAYSFNNQIRFNKSLGFNNPFGENRSHLNNRMRDNLTNFVKALKSKDVRFHSESFEMFDLSNLSEDDFVYCDPPYLITNAVYNAGWGEEEERNLSGILDDLNSRGVRFALSNVLEHKGKENTILLDWVQDGGYFVFDLNASYANSTHNTTRLSSREVLITNYNKETTT